MLSSTLFNYVFMYSSFSTCIMLLASTARGANPGGPGVRAGRVFLTAPKRNMPSIGAYY